MLTWGFTDSLNAGVNKPTSGQVSRAVAHGENKAILMIQS